MGIEDYLNTDSWKLIEWPQKIENLLEAEMQKVEVLIENETTRKLKLC
jgi:tRNA threonylcarbamoyladenosine biosynthesis protein TsaE